MAAPASDKPFLQRVVERFAVALVVGLLIAFVASFDVVRSSGPVDRLRQEGAAAALTAAAVWNERVRGEAPRPRGASMVTLLDVDEEACAGIVGFVPCRFGRIGYPEVLDNALAAADAASPRVIILDIQLPSQAEAKSSAAGRRLLERIGKPGRPIVAPIPYGENPDGAITINWAQSICGAPACGRLRFAPAFASDRYGSVRRYPVRVSADMVSNLSAGAASVKRASIQSFAGAAVAAMGDAPGTDDAVLIAYTMPSIAGLRAEQAASVQATYAESVEYYRLSQFLRQSPGRFLPPRPQNIMIVGSSAPVSEDWHETPLGQMSGMEVVANAVRTLEMQAAGTRIGVEPEAGWGGRLLAWTVLLIAMMLLTVVERRRAKRRTGKGLPPEPLLADRYSILTVAILLAALGVEALLQTWEALHRLESPGARTGDLDIFLPLIVIFFTTAVELLHRLIHRLEHLAAIGLARIWKGGAKADPAVAAGATAADASKPAAAVEDAAAKAGAPPPRAQEG